MNYNKAVKQIAGDQKTAGPGVARNNFKKKKFNQHKSKFFDQKKKSKKDD